MDLDQYYDHIRQSGRLRTNQHAQRWSDGVLRTLGTNLDRGTKRAVAKELPEELAKSLKSVFSLNFRDPTLSLDDFLLVAARRSGNSNGEFAYYPTLAVFSGIRQLLSDSLVSRVADTLSPELRDFWEQADLLAPVAHETSLARA